MYLHTITMDLKRREIHSDWTQTRSNFIRSCVVQSDARELFSWRAPILRGNGSNHLEILEAQLSQWHLLNQCVGVIEKHNSNHCRWKFKVLGLVLLNQTVKRFLSTGQHFPRVGGSSCSINCVAGLGNSCLAREQSCLQPVFHCPPNKQHTNILYDGCQYAISCQLIKQFNLHSSLSLCLQAPFSAE